jgi:hypothetical protein
MVSFDSFAVFLLFMGLTILFSLPGSPDGCVRVNIIIARMKRQFNHQLLKFRHGFGRAATNPTPALPKSADLERAARGRVGLGATPTFAPIPNLRG